VNSWLWSIKSLARRRLRTSLTVLGIAISAALLLDMVMLSGGIEKSFADLLMAKGYQIRLSPKGTLPFDTEATLQPAASIVRRLRQDPDIAAAGAVLGASLYGHGPDSLVTLFGYGIQPEGQGLYWVQSGGDIDPADTNGVLLSTTAAGLLDAGVGDTVTMVGTLDPQVMTGRLGRKLTVRGLVRWAYDYRGQPSVGTVLPVMQSLAYGGREDRASLILVKAQRDQEAPMLAGRLRTQFPGLEVYSVGDLVEVFKKRLVYFRQLSYILGAMSLVVSVLLISTLLTITINERLGEIVTLRAIGVARSTIVRQVLIEGAVLTLAGSAIGLVLGLGTARYLDSILTSFPGLPAAFSFFVPRRESVGTAVVVLLAAGCLAGLYPAWLAARAPIAATLRSEAT
jgi:putative ABC transport system permease protein